MEIGAQLYTVRDFCKSLEDFSLTLKKVADIGYTNVQVSGNLNFDRIFQVAEKSGTKYMLVEQDNCNGEDPFECLRRSYNYLKSLGF